MLFSTSARELTPRELTPEEGKYKKFRLGERLSASEILSKYHDRQAAEALNKVDMLLKAGIDADTVKEGGVLLNDALLVGWVDMVALLLQHLKIVPVLRPTHILSVRDYRSQEEALRLTNLLLAAGCDPNMWEYETTLLIEAARIGWKDMVGLLLKQPDIDTTGALEAANNALTECIERGKRGKKRASNFSEDLNIAYNEVIGALKEATAARPRPRSPH